MSFDLFQGLADLSGRDLEWYSRLTEEEQKAAHPFVIARWMAGTGDRAQLVRLNTFVNPYVFSLAGDKGLLFSLLAAAATGKTRRYSWIKAPGAKAATRLKVEVIRRYYDASAREAAAYADAIDDEDVMAMAEECGLDKDELAKLKKEVGDGSGSTKKPSGVKKK